MELKNTSLSYGSVSKFLHWLIFLLVLTIIIVGYWMGTIQDKPLRGTVVNIHKLIGLSIFLLMIIRLLWTLINIKPSLPWSTPAWERWSERGMHVFLYLLLFIMPLSGWIGSTASGHAPRLGEMTFAFPIEQNKNLADFLFDNIHIPFAIILIVFISLHILAALYHYLIRKDNILQRMLPNGRE